jgi:hypothetical protein
MSLNVDLDYTVTDPYVFEGTFDLEAPLSYDLQWNVSFSYIGNSKGYLVWPHMICSGNWSASTSQGAFVGNFSMYLNGEFSYNFWVSLTVPFNPDPLSWGFAEVSPPSLQAVENNVDFSSMKSGENLLTISCHFYSVIEQSGTANMDIYIGPLIVDIIGYKGSDGIPDPFQPFFEFNAYFITLLWGIFALPVTEAIRISARRL